MNRQITRLAFTAVGLIVSLVVATTYWQAWAAGDLADRQDNQIERVAQFTIKRGEITGTSRAGFSPATSRRRSAAGRSTSAATRRGLSPRTPSATRRSRARAPGSSAR